MSFQAKIITKFLKVNIHPQRAADGLAVKLRWQHNCTSIFYRDLDLSTQQTRSD